MEAAFVPISSYANQNKPLSKLSNAFHRVNTSCMPYKIVVCRSVITLAGATISFVSLYPTFKTASVFNNFPGSRQLAQCAVVNFGLFSTWGFWKFGELVFHESSSDNTARKIVRIAVTGVLAVGTRIPIAAQALKIAPISSNSRVPYACVDLFGTSGGEFASTYKTCLALEKKLARAFTSDRVKITAYQLKDNILNCLEGLRVRTLHIPEDQKAELFHNFNNIRINYTSLQVKETANTLFSLILTHENRNEYARQVDILQQRSCQRINIGMSSTTGAIACLVQSILMTHLTLTYFFPDPATWKWVVSVLIPQTVTYTYLTICFLSLYKIYDTLCGNKLHTNFAEKYYPKTYYTLAAGFLIQAALLFGLLYETTKANMDPRSWYGMLLVILNTFGAMLLNAFTSRSLMVEKPLQLFSLTPFANTKAKQGAVLLDDLDSMKEVIENLRLDDLCKMLDGVTLSDESLNILANNTPIINLNDFLKNF